MKNPVDGQHQVFDLIKKYAEEKGLLSDLEESLKDPEKDRFDSEATRQNGLSVLDAVHCVVDKNRTFAFLDEIAEVVDPNDAVLEAGIGTGILSFAAALKAKKVIGIEINKATIELANDIMARLGDTPLFEDVIKKIAFFNADATKFETADRFNVFISENIYTGMFYEKQVQIANALNRFMVPGYKTIPEKMLSYVALSETVFPEEEYGHTELFVPLEHQDELSSKLLSKEQLYNTLDFTKIVSEEISFESRFEATQDGTVNSIFITSKVLLPSGRSIIGKDTTFFNNDIVIAIKPALRIKKGQFMRIKISYEAGDDPTDMTLEATLD